MSASHETRMPVSELQSRRQASLSPGEYWRKDEERKRELIFALRSRVLTDEEMAEVASYDISLVITPNVSYMREEKDKYFNDLLLQQFKLRAALISARELTPAATEGKQNP